jgi:AmmeMemoRadiSam system protein B
MSSIAAIRPPAVAGSFYPAERSSLAKEIDVLLSRAERIAGSGSIVGLIAPHAGYRYSGLTAAYAYCQLRGAAFDTVVIVAPSHCEYFDGISVYNGDAYATPLGIVNVDAGLRERLTAGDAVITASESGHREEHAIEVQLPFLQRGFSGFSILPIVIGDQRKQYCDHLGTRLADLLAGTRSLLVASSDLSHYHAYDAANRLDQIVIDDVKSFDADKLMGDLEANRAEACGGGPIAAVMVAARGLRADGVRLLHHCNSGDVTGERGRVVGYLSAALLRTN